MFGAAHSKFFAHRVLSILGFTLLLSQPVIGETLPERQSRVAPLPDRPKMGTSFGTNDQGAVRRMTVAQLQAVAQKKLDRDLITKFLGPLPEWVQRIEVTGNFNLAGWSGLEILTVQPLWRSDDGRSIVFTQLSAINYRMFDRQRFAGNMGFGYRRLFLEDRLMLGGNIFHDHEFLRGHDRTGLGAEARFGPMDFTVNGYLGLNQRSLNDGGRERVPNGFDLELATQVPYLPWAKLYGKYYHWDHEVASQPMRGVQLAASANLHRALSIEAGLRRDQDQKSEGFFMLRVRLNAESAVGLLDGAPLLDKQVFAPRDLRQSLTEKVRRENRIILERSNPSGARKGLTISVSRGN
jgi:hypothetical protein